MPLTRLWHAFDGPAVTPPGRAGPRVGVALAFTVTATARPGSQPNLSSAPGAFVSRSHQQPHHRAAGLREPPHMQTRSLARRATPRELRRLPRREYEQLPPPTAPHPPGATETPGPRTAETPSDHRRRRHALSAYDQRRYLDRRRADCALFTGDFLSGSFWPISVLKRHRGRLSALRSDPARSPSGNFFEKSPGFLL